MKEVVLKCVSVRKNLATLKQFIEYFIWAPIPSVLYFSNGLYTIYIDLILNTHLIKQSWVRFKEDKLANAIFIKKQNFSASLAQICFLPFIEIDCFTFCVYIATNFFATTPCYATITKTRQATTFGPNNIVALSRSRENCHDRPSLTH